MAERDDELEFELEGEPSRSGGSPILGRGHDRDTSIGRSFRKTKSKSQQQPNAPALGAVARED